MNKRIKIKIIFLIFLFVNLTPYNGEGQSNQNQDISIDISPITQNVNGLAIVDNHFWVLGSNETSDNPDVMNVLYKINSVGELVDSFLLLEGSRRIRNSIPGQPFEYYSYTTLAFDGTDFLLYSGTPFGGISGRSIIYKYDTNGEHVEEFIISVTDPSRDRNIAYGDNYLWVQTADQIDAIDLNLDIPDFAHRYNHPGTGGTVIVKDIFWGNNGLWIYYGGNDRDELLVNYDYVNDKTLARYSLDPELEIHDIYYAGETFWMIQEIDNQLLLTTYEPIESKSTYDKYIVPVFTIASLSFVSILGYSSRLIWLRKNKFIPLPNTQLKILGDLFKSQTSLYYVLTGQSIFKDKSVENEIRKRIPKNIFNFKFLMYPVRLSITKLLYEQMEFSSVELKEILGIPWNEYNNNIKALEKKEYIRISKKFIEGSSRQVVSITNYGIDQFKNLADLLHLFLDSTIDYKAYIDNVINLKTEIVQDRDSLFPKS